MKLKTLVKHLIMQYPNIFPNALAVYNHLFYVIGNGYEWKDGELHEIGGEIKQISEKNCIKGMINSHTDFMNQTIKIYNERKENGLIDEYLTEELTNNLKEQVKKDIETETHIIKHAKELSEDFSVPGEIFVFYPICKGYSRCTTIPENIKPDWLEGINKINKLREKLIKENPKLDPQYERKDSQN